MNTTTTATELDVDSLMAAIRETASSRNLQHHFDLEEAASSCNVEHHVDPKKIRRLMQLFPRSFQDLRLGYVSRRNSNGGMMIIITSTTF